MTSIASDTLYEVSINGENQISHDYLELEPATMSHPETDNAMRSGPNPKPRTPMRRPDNKEPTEADKILQLQENNALQKKVICVLIVVVVVYGILLLILISIVVFGVMQGFNGKDKGLQQPLGQPWYANMSGAVYVRWGRTTCPTVSEIAYAGIAGGKWFDHSGSGSNYLCLPEDPEYDEYNAGVETGRGYVYSAEYQIHDFPPFAGKLNHEVPCAVCRTANRSSVMMIPAKMTCPSGWTEEYHGYLMAQADHHQNSEYVCVDRNPEEVPGGNDNHHGAVFFTVEGRCDGGNLPCAPYINGAELTCVVCSK